MTILTISNKIQNQFIECRNRRGTTVLCVCKSRSPHQMDAHIWSPVVQMSCDRQIDIWYRGVQVNSHIGKVKNAANCFQSGKFIFIGNVFLKMASKHPTNLWTKGEPMKTLRSFRSTYWIPQDGWMHGCIMFICKNSHPCQIKIDIWGPSPYAFSRSFVMYM